MANFVNKLADFIEKQEGLRLYVYQDQHGVYTQGFGHTTGITQYSAPITREQAIAWLQEDMQNAINDIEDKISVPLTDNQKIALISLVFNEGPAPLNGHLGEYLNSGDYDLAAAQFSSWVYIHENGEAIKSDGLVTRRAAEKTLFLTPDDEDTEEDETQSDN